MLDPVRIRFRIDSAFKADDAARVARGEPTQWMEPAEVVGVDPAQPGDCWRVRWMATVDQRAAGIEGGIAGYDICCPKCLKVHGWTQARNCGQKTSGGSCAHSGVSSCWNWTGNAEDGTLSASPSLHCDASIGGCGWHGFLTNGELKHC